MLTGLGRTNRLALFAFLLTAMLAAAPSAPGGQGALLGVEAIVDALPVFDGRVMRDPSEGDAFPPMRVLLSRSRYWAQDGHLDVVVQLDEDAPQGELRVRILGEGDRELSRFVVSPLPGPRFVVYPAIPGALLQGGAAEVETVWVRDGQAVAEGRRAFRVEVFHEPVARSGRIRLHVPNDAGASQSGVPATVGVPFPRGVLADAANLRLVDGAGAEIPLQAKETARWSRFGSVKWVLCDFTVDLDGGTRELFLEYGPEALRGDAPPIRVAPAEGFPRVDAGRLRFDRGLWFDPAGDGNFVKVLGENALAGAFVEHEDGRLFRMPSAAGWEAEESGPEKVVLTQKGWYAEEGGGQEFCQYVVRCVIHRGSPFVRIFHTWIFTGDGNRDRIANMGWRFDLAEGLAPGGFLTDFGEDGQWEQADYLLQWDYEHYDLVSGDERTERPGGRAPGAALAEGDGVRLHFGARDFWQNYPSELEFRDGALWFHNWPRHNRPAGYNFEGEKSTRPGQPALPSAARHQHYEPGKLSRSEWKLNLAQARFAHEGRMLDFRLPDAASGDPIWSRVVLGQGPGTHDWIQGEPDSINAQGISRTEEMWLYLTPKAAEGAAAKRVLEGLNDETLRAVADPEWMAKSGAFYEIRHQDRANYPEEERLYELLALAPGMWQEQLGMYGMWLHGDMYIWARLSLEDREPSMYRALRKGHHGWPYSWIPYARTGDPRLLRLASAATRQQIDANYTHYVGEELLQRTEELFPRRTRRIGLWNVGPLPWAGQMHTQSRSMHNKVDSNLFAWYMTGYARALDNMRCWMGQAKAEEGLSRRGPMGTGDRNSITMLKTFLETYEATFDPWFLAAAHAIAEGHRTRYEDENYAGHFFHSGDREFLRFTGDERFAEYYLHYADVWGGHWQLPSWQVHGVPLVESNAFAWRLTGKEYYLRRVADFLDQMKMSVWEGDGPEYVRGYYARGSAHAPAMFTGWAIQYFPLALAALEEAGRRPEPVPDLFQINMRDPVVAMRKEAGEPLKLRLLSRIAYWRRVPQREAQYAITGPGGFEMAGTWMVEDETHLAIPADAPAGTYRLRIEDARSLVVPVLEGVGAKEVIVCEPGEEMQLGRFVGQAWFRVPEGVEQFTVEFPVNRGHYARRLTVWNPDGERAWDMHYYRPTHEGGNVARADIQVPPGQAGRLWRITLPDSGASFRMDEVIPPIYSASRDKWFDPGL